MHSYDIMKFLDKVISSGKTVFSISDIQDITNYQNKHSVESFLYRAQKSNLLVNLRKGIWALPNYDKFELACKMRKNSYISMETVLYKEALIFQYYENTITCISDDTRTYTVDDTEFRYSKIKNLILNNSLGIKSYKNYRIATPERALCDMFYLNPLTSIENPDALNKVRLSQIMKFYPKQTILNIKKQIFDVV